jgi:hypothetical protein
MKTSDKILLALTILVDVAAVIIVLFFAPGT